MGSKETTSAHAFRTHNESTVALLNVASFAIVLATTPYNGTCYQNSTPTLTQAHNIKYIPIIRKICSNIALILKDSFSTGDKFQINPLKNVQKIHHFTCTII